MPFAPIAAITQIAAPSAATATAGTSAASNIGSSFGDMLTKALGQVEGSQNNADVVSQLAATGKATPTDVLTATTEAQLMVQTATVLRNRGVEAFNEIMRMQV